MLGRIFFVYRCVLIFFWFCMYWDVRNVSYEYFMNVLGLNGKKYFSLKMRCFYESISIYKYEW